MRMIDKLPEDDDDEDEQNPLNADENKPRVIGDLIKHADFLEKN